MMSFRTRPRHHIFASKITAMIDVTTLTQLITQFRNTTQSNSVSPETVGSILQKITDILATAGTQANLDIINKWHEALKSAAPALTALSLGADDGDNVYLNTRSVNLYTGEQTELPPLAIRQATAERAGVMRAQQVIDLDNAKKDVSSIRVQIAVINKLLGIGTSDTLYKDAQISCQAIDGKLHILGASKLMAQGFVPYLFRNVRKRNPFKLKWATDEQKAKKHCPVKKGWAIMGSRYSVHVNGDIVEFSTNPHSLYCCKAEGYTTSPSVLVSRHVRKDGTVSFGLGRSSVSLADPKNPAKERMVRITFGIGFAKPMNPGIASITPANLVSSLATFTIIYDPGSQEWAFNSR